MKVVFATPLRAQASTIIGRVVPLAHELASNHDIHVFVLGQTPSTTSSLHWHSVGAEPFTRTAAGKKRYKGLRLIGNMLATAMRTTRLLWRLKPDAVVIVKPLPSNTLGVYLWHVTRRLYKLKANSYKLILDTDDFELAANQLSSLIQRAAVHWSERTAANISSTIVAATPFLADHFEQLTAARIPTILIPTGLTLPTDSRPNRQSTDHPHLAYLGSISQSSGHRVDLLPDILEKVRNVYPEATVTIAGDGDDIHTLQQEFGRRHLDDAVTWSGRFTLSKVEGLLFSNTIIIDPIDASIANRAKSSFRVALATLLGLPVVTSNVGIRPYLIPDALHSRFFAAPADTDAYVQRILNLISQPLTTDETASLQHHAQRFRWPTLARTYTAILEQ